MICFYYYKVTIEPKYRTRAWQLWLLNLFVIFCWFTWPSYFVSGLTAGLTAGEGAAQLDATAANITVPSFESDVLARLSPVPS